MLTEASSGNSKWADWVIGDEDVAISHFKAAWEMGINTWEYVLVPTCSSTSTDCQIPAVLRTWVPFSLLAESSLTKLLRRQVYSGGDSERLVGKAIKTLQIPRDELVILTKVFMPVSKDPATHPSTLTDPDAQGYVNLHGLSRCDQNLYTKKQTELTREPGSTSSRASRLRSRGSRSVTAPRPCQLLT